MSELRRSQVAGGQGDPGVPTLRPMIVPELDDVMAIEIASYAYPWSRGNFIDSLAGGYPARVLFDAQDEVLGYFVAMTGVDEMHLLNVTVAPAVQGRGHGSFLICALTTLCRENNAQQLWLEVRQSNERARTLYQRLGFTAVGVRKNYYPAPFSRREDAVVMSLQIGPIPEESHAVD